MGEQLRGPLSPAELADATITGILDHLMSEALRGHPKVVLDSDGRVVELSPTDVLDGILQDVTAGSTT